MKLYATTTSERARKGQGGNEFLEIEIKNEKKEICFRMLVKPTEPLKVRIDYDRYRVAEIKKIPWEWGKNKS